MEELVELGPGAEVGRGLSLARDSHGIYVAEAPKSLRLRQGDRVLGARVSFEGASPEAVGRLLEGAGGCRVSLYLRRRSPGAPAATPEGQRDGGVARLTIPIPTPSKKPPPAPVPPAAAAAPVSVELALPKLPKLPKPRGAPAPAAPAPPEPPRPPRPRLTVREAAAARTPLPEPPEPPELPRAPGEPPAGSGPRIPAMEVAAPKGSLGLSPPQIRPGKGGPEAGGDEEGAAAARGAFPALRVPSVSIDVPRAVVELVPELGMPGPAPPGTGPEAGSRFAEGLRKLSRELEAPAVGISPKPPKFRLPRLGWALAKLREGGGTPPASPPGIAIPSVELDLGAVGDAGAKLKVPKLSLAPFGDAEDGARFGIGDSGGAPGSPRLRVPRFGIGAAAALPKFGGSSPDLRPGGVPKAPPKRGGSAESLILGWTAPEPPATLRPRPKSRGVSAPPWPARIAIPAVGLALPGQAPERPGGRGAAEPPALKVPVLELAPPGSEGTSEPPARRFGVKLPKFGAGSAGSGSGSSGRMRMGGSKPSPEEGGAPRHGNPRPGGARRRRWVPRVGFTPGGASPEPPKVGRMRFPDVELCPGDPQIAGIGGISSRCDLEGPRGGEGTPKFQLPQLVLSPQICSEP